MPTTIRDDGAFMWTGEAPIKRLSSERLTLVGAAQSCTIPAGTRRIRIAAESGDIRLSLSGSAATAASAWYVPQNTVEWISVRETVTISVFGAATCYANLMYLGID